ncbi:transposase [Xanthomonas oryzae]|uniref:Transposase n=1 Tax=Xanthomonas oryzae TaxID=347 RepID=A0AAP1F0D4_9XANT|nr:IS5 family transposase [Xanthomonas oryzae]KOR49982.1 transposase [Xanthomonas oryzae]QBG83142.1 IS5 family transposase [Xanthomonas oryzae]
MGRPPKIQAEHEAMLLEIVESDPTATIEEVRLELSRRCNVKVHDRTLASTLKRLGIERMPSHEVVTIEKAETDVPRYGYTDAHRRQTPEQAYPSCLIDAAWELVKDIFENEGGRGSPPRISRRVLVDACCYVVRSGGSWRMLPRHFPRWQNVYRTFHRWSEQGKFEQMHDRLRAQWRQREGKNAEPTAAVIDAQSTRGSPQGGDSGYDAGKKIKGRKRHLVVDTLGLLLAVSITAASVQDRQGAHPVLERAMEKYPGIQALYADSGYAGQCAQTVSQCHDIRVQIVRHPGNKNVGRWIGPEQPDLFTVKANVQGFVVLAKRWVVERTHAWNDRARRLIMHHDRLTQVSDAWVWLAEARLLLRRLTV